MFLYGFLKLHRFLNDFFLFFCNFVLQLINFILYGSQIGVELFHIIGKVGLGALQLLLNGFHVRQSALKLVLFLLCPVDFRFLFPDAVVGELTGIGNSLELPCACGKQQKAQYHTKGSFYSFHPHSLVILLSAS